MSTTIPSVRTTSSGTSDGAADDAVDTGRDGAVAASSLSVFDLFTVGVGPSSSHTVGPMRAARDFVVRLDGRLDDVVDVEVELFGSLAATGRGHGTLRAVVLGLEGCAPDEVAPSEITARAERIAAERSLRLGGRHPIGCHEDAIVLSSRTVLPRHANALRLRALGRDGSVVDDAVYYSVGGGFVVRDGEEPDASPGGSGTAPLPFSTAAELLDVCAREGLDLAGVVLRNEVAVHGDAATVRAGVLRLRDVMDECVAAGIAAHGELPGGLRVRRRAPGWAARLRVEDPDRSPAYASERVSLVALAVNEENAAGGRVVTAPTNGAAGIVPAVLDHACHDTPAALAGRDRDDIAVQFLLTATAIGALVKTRASISGAEVGCQGEVGSAASMAAGALAAVLGGTPAQVENAAEIAMEHHLGLTCDPIGGLVQIPCIERNAVAANKAVHAARMALWGDGTHRVSLDAVIDTMRRTGADMNDKYKETAEGGLAVAVVEC